MCPFAGDTNKTPCWQVHSQLIAHHGPYLEVLLHHQQGSNRDARSPFWNCKNFNVVSKFGTQCTLKWGSTVPYNRQQNDQRAPAWQIIPCPGEPTFTLGPPEGYLNTRNKHQWSAREKTHQTTFAAIGLVTINYYSHYFINLFHLHQHNHINP